MGYSVSKHLLFVDDDAGLRQIVTLVFEAEGYRVTAVDCGFSTLAEMLQPQPPNIVIVGDLAPRPETSIGLVNDLRQAFNCRTLPVIMLSTQVATADVTCGYAAGATVYLPKPFGVVDLVARVNALLARAA